MSKLYNTHPQWYVCCGRGECWVHPSKPHKDGGQFQTFSCKHSNLHFHQGSRHSRKPKLYPELLGVQDLHSSHCGGTFIRFYMYQLPSTTFTHHDAPATKVNSFPTLNPQEAFRSGAHFLFCMQTLQYAPHSVYNNTHTQWYVLGGVLFFSFFLSLRSHSSLHDSHYRRIFIPFTPSTYIRTNKWKIPLVWEQHEPLITPHAAQ